MKFNLKYISVVLLGFIFIFSCTKDEITPTPPGNDPIFSVKGSIDGQELSMEAGEDNTFMHTDIANVNGVDEYRGALMNSDSKLQINIFDGMLDIPDLNTDIIGNEIFIAPSPSEYLLATLSKDLFANSATIEKLEWTINGVKKENEKVFIKEPGKYEICADIIFSNGTTGSTCNTFLIGYEQNSNPTLDYYIGENGEIISYAQSVNNNISSIQWYRNDVLVSKKTLYMDSTSGLDHYALKAKIKFKNGAFREREIWVDRNDIDYQIGDFSAIENQSNLTWDHKAVIEITLDDEKYISHPGSNEQIITIDNSVNYGTNNSGEKVTIIEGKLSATFRKVSTQEDLSGTFDIRFGIAH